MQIDMAIVSIIFAAMLSSIIGLLVWLVKESNEGKIKRHEQSARLIALSDVVKDLAHSFEKMRDKMDAHIENSDCRRRL